MSQYRSDEGRGIGRAKEGSGVSLILRTMSAMQQSKHGSDVRLRLRNDVE